MDLGLDGKVVIVTGGTDGLGAALAQRLVIEGARVAVCGRDEARVREMKSRLGGAGGDGLAVVADVTVPADLERLVAETIDRWGRIDGLVNNAGTAAAGSFESISDEEWTADLELKVMAAVRLVRLVLPHMRTAGGSIVNVLSLAAKSPGPGSLPSSASRATGMAISKALSKELGSDGIRVNAVLIGLIESGQSRRRAEATGQSLEDMYRKMATGIPIGRVGRPEEFADLVSYLLSERASYVTGSAINLDGGLSPVV